MIQWARARSSGVPATILRVGMVAAGAGVLSTAILMAAIQQLPAIRFEVRRLGFFDVVEQLVTGEADVIFAPGPITADDRIRRVAVSVEPRVLIVPSYHRLAPRESISIADIRDEVFLAPTEGDPEIIAWWLVDPRPDGSHPKRAPGATDIDGLLELAAAGVGVNIAGASAARHYGRSGLSFLPILDIPPAEILLCSLREPLTPVVREFEVIAAQLWTSPRG